AGVRVKDEFSGKEYGVRAKVVVNATGPWAEETMNLGGTPVPKDLLLSKGIHLLFRAGRLPVEGAVALKSPSGREGFAIRRWNFVYVGTSDEAHHGDLDRPKADRAAVLDVLKMAQDCFPSIGLTEQDIVSTWAGLRPLIAEEGRSPRDTSRHDEVWRGPEGLLTIAGGKLTTYRPMAQRVMAHVARELGRDLGDNHRTTEVPLPGGDLGGQEFAAFQQEMRDALQTRDVSDQAAERVTWLYGNRVRELLRLGDEDQTWLQPLAAGVPALRGEVKLAMEQEMAGSLNDFMDRRSALLIFSQDHGLAAAEEVSRLMAERLGWSEADRAEQVEQYRQTAGTHGVPAE
ncbi:MAG: FAD-dependent oxidoreductase, partial [Firmicutes bacterium]|nr:FAD-dependent oxidoreductase [Bacillota bacterium]